MSSIFKHKNALLPNLLIITYIVTAYLGGLWLILSDPIVFNVSGIFVFAHAMIIAAYLIHDCAHYSIFKNNRYHRWLAEILLWVCGSSYSDFDDIRHKHFRHHADNADIVSFDFRVKILKYPRLVKTIKFLEWLYIPAMEVVMHVLVLILPFVKKSRQHRRSRIVTVLVLRVLFFTFMANISLKILVLYPVSYMVFLIVMRFMDIHQHTYELYETLDNKRGLKEKKFDRDFERTNTYSNLISIKHPLLNLLVLNFSYHNAHHEYPIRSWHLLPSLHKELYGNDETQVLMFKDLIKSYHRYRVERILNEDKINMPVKEMKEKFIGVDGVSFLTAH